MKKKPFRKKAVALGYDESRDSAPKVLAKGTGLLAERIIELAKKYGIHTYEDPDLVEVLSAVEIDNEIPRELYRAVAEVLAFVYRLNSNYKS
ncbi:MAG: EscU/YscU/HrcU family type III secretion system export apparatus switch protein [Candidatus Aureabacteria bacterium]|nr:EscU/YscU/HrcU family type III secretion system export apparatus switch protein [Candidatus Auribacterota bacterium]